MKIVKSPNQLRQTLQNLRSKGKRIGFVPTMGSLHKGHLSLVRCAKTQTDIVVVSIFVNPIQFGPHEDFRQYPRSLKRDQKLLKGVGTDYLFIPSRLSVFPKRFRNYTNPGPLARYLCGPKRPWHFRGVATVVNRLFEIVEPHVAYFGEKDYQQARIIEEMVRRLRLSIKIKTCPIVREADGVAMSSRNSYLSKRERISARSLYRSLMKAEELIRAGEFDISRIKKAMRDILLSHVTKIEYIEIVDPRDLTPLKRLRLPALVAIACYLGFTRLIDNLVVKI